MPTAGRYRVVETSEVTAEELEAILNRESARGWRFDGLHFVVRDNSRRPAMAFVLFTREAPGEEETRIASDTNGRITDET